MIAKITLQTNTGKEIELTIDEAKDLYNQLGKIFNPLISIKNDQWNPYKPMYCIYTSKN